MSRYHWIDYIKSLGIILVALGHTSGISMSVTKWIFAFHMPLFFFVSGFLLPEKSLSIPFDQYAKFRLVPLFRAYFLFSAIGFVFYCFRSCYSAASQQPLLEAMITKLIAIAYGSGTTTGALQVFPVVLWFFPALIVSRLILFSINRANPGIPRLILLILTIACAYVLKDLALPWEIESGLAATPFVFIGYIFRGCPAWQRSLASAKPIFPVGCLMAGSWLALNHARVDLRSSLFGDIWFSVPACLLILLGFIAFAMKFPKQQSVSTISDATLFIFPLHTLLFVLIDSTLKRIPNISSALINDSTIYGVVKSIFAIGVLCLIFPIFCYMFPEISGRASKFSGKAAT